MILEPEKIDALCEVLDELCPTGISSTYAGIPLASIQ
jgi:hypothetical protein